MVETPLDESAAEFAAKVLKRNERPPRVRDRSDRIASSESNLPRLFAEARHNAERRFAGRTSPLKAIAAIEAASVLPFEEGMAYEARLFDECQHSAEHRALAHLFFAERAARKVPGLTARADHPLDRVAVIGAGTMGCGIALAFAAKVHGHSSSAASPGGKADRSGMEIIPDRLLVPQGNSAVEIV
jgi:3-hydroxyacyl-CoA dehydrogenase